MEPHQRRHSNQHQEPYEPLNSRGRFLLRCWASSRPIDSHPAMWRRIQVWRRRRIWKRQSRTHLLRDPGFAYLWGDASKDRFLLEQVEGYGKNLWEWLETRIEEHRFVHDLPEGQNVEMENWAIDLDELIAGGLVEKRGDDEYVLTRDGKSQLHSLRAAAKTDRRLRIAVVSLVVSTAALVINVVLQVIGLLTG